MQDHSNNAIPSLSTPPSSPSPIQLSPLSSPHSIAPHSAMPQEIEESDNDFIPNSAVLQDIKRSDDNFISASAALQDIKRSSNGISYPDELGAEAADEDAELRLTCLLSQFTQEKSRIKQQLKDAKGDSGLELQLQTVNRQIAALAVSLHQACNPVAEALAQSASFNLSSPSTREAARDHERFPAVSSAPLSPQSPSRLDEKNEPLSPERETKSKADSPAHLWGSRYFKRAKKCIEKALQSGLPVEKNLARFKLYLGPPIYALNLRHHEELITQQLYRCRALAAHDLWDAVREKIEAIRSDLDCKEDRYSLILAQLPAIHKKWKKESLDYYCAQVIEPAATQLTNRHSPDTIREHFTRPLLRQYGNQLEQMWAGFEQEDAVQTFNRRRNLAAFERYATRKMAELAASEGARGDKYIMIKESHDLNIENEKAKFLTDQKKQIQEDISQFSQQGEAGVLEICRFYSPFTQPLLPAALALLIHPVAEGLNEAERAERSQQIEALKQQIAHDFITELEDFWGEQGLTQADVQDAQGNTLLHHAMHRLAGDHSPLGRAFLLQFIATLYEHGSLADMENYKGQTPYVYSNIIPCADNPDNTALKWQLVILHLRYTLVYGEAEKHIKEQLLNYSQDMPAFSQRPAFIQWFTDMHGTKRTRRFTEIWHAMLSLNQARVNLNTVVFFNKLEELRAHPESRADSSSLFRGLDRIEACIRAGKYVVTQKNVEDSEAEAQQKLAESQGKLAESQQVLQATQAENTQLKQQFQEMCQQTKQGGEQVQQLQQQLQQQKEEMQQQKEEMQQQKEAMEQRLQAQEQRMLALFAQFSGQSAPAPLQPAASSLLEAASHPAQAIVVAPSGAAVSGLVQQGFLSTRPEAKRTPGVSGRVNGSEQPPTFPVSAGSLTPAPAGESG